MSKHKRSASRTRRSEELVRAAALLRQARPDLATRLQEQARFLSDREPLCAGLGTDLSRLYGELRATSRDQLVEAGKALLDVNPSMAHLLFSQAAHLVTSQKLRSHISALASNARRRAEQLRATARHHVASPRTVPPPVRE